MLRLVADRAVDNPAAFALLAPGRLPLTYARMYAEIGEHAHTLRAIGISKEDRVALLLPNGPEAALGFLATSAISVCAPLNPGCTANELDTSLSHLKPKALIASPALDIEKHAVAGKHGISVVTATPDLKREAGVFTLSASTKVRCANDVLLQPSDVALLLHTSGTTSLRGRFGVDAPAGPASSYNEANPRYTQFMRKSTNAPKKKRGPPKGYGAKGSKKILVAVPPNELAAIDAWIKQQPDKPSRPEALRRLARLWLASTKS